MVPPMTLNLALAPPIATSGDLAVAQSSQAGLKNSKGMDATKPGTNASGKPIWLQRKIAQNSQQHRLDKSKSLSHSRLVAKAMLSKVRPIQPADSVISNGPSSTNVISGDDLPDQAVIDSCADENVNASQSHHKKRRRDSDDLDYEEGGDEQRCRKGWGNGSRNNRARPRVKKQRTTQTLESSAPSAGDSKADDESEIFLVDGPDRASYRGAVRAKLIECVGQFQADVDDKKLLCPSRALNLLIERLAEFQFTRFSRTLEQFNISSPVAAPDDSLSADGYETATFVLQCRNHVSQTVFIHASVGPEETICFPMKINKSMTHRAPTNLYISAPSFLVPMAPRRRIDQKNSASEFDETEASVNGPSVTVSHCVTVSTKKKGKTVKDDSATDTTGGKKTAIKMVCMVGGEVRHARVNHKNLGDSKIQHASSGSSPKRISGSQKSEDESENDDKNPSCNDDKNTGSRVGGRSRKPKLEENEKDDAENGDSSKKGQIAHNKKLGGGGRPLKCHLIVSSQSEVYFEIRRRPGWKPALPIWACTKLKKLTDSRVIALNPDFSFTPQPS